MPKRSSAVRLAALLTVPTLALAMGCAPKEEAPKAATGTKSCKLADLPLKTPGQLTVATDSPAYDPWFQDNDPTNGKGFESAVAYAVAKQMGFKRSQVHWMVEPFNNSYAPGEKKFDFDINQISISPARARAVDFSQGYYSASQAVVALKKEGLTPGSLSDLKSLKLGAQTGSTSLTAIREDVRPTQQPLVFQNTNIAKQALLNGQVDAIVADLPTAFYISSAEIKGSTILGQFRPSTGHPEQFGLLMQKGSGLKTCVNRALDKLKSSGKLAAIQQRWLSQTVKVPVLK